MGRRHYKVEEIIHKLREAEVHIANGKSVVEASKQIGVAEQTFYRWKKRYGGLGSGELRRLKVLEEESRRRLILEARLLVTIILACGC